MNFDRNVRCLLEKDLFCRLADIHYQEWGHQLGVNTSDLNAFLMVDQGERLIQRWAYCNGIPTDSAPLEMARRLGINLSMKQRLLFSEKARCVRLGAVCSLHESELPASPLGSLNVQLKNFFQYVTPDGKNVSGGMVYLEDDNGNTLRMPVTPWQRYPYEVKWDYLSWDTPLPLFNTNGLFVCPEKFVFILPSEEDVTWLTQNVAWLASQFTLTTWPGGLRETLQYADWGLLASREVAIVVHPSVEGVLIAETLFEQLEKAGVQQIGFVLPEAQLTSKNDWWKQIAMEHDIGRVILKGRVSPRDQFLAFAECEFGLKLAPKKEQALLLPEFFSLPVLESTWLIPDLIRKGDRVMVYGVAKSGKTTWTIQEALHMAAAGHSLLYVDGEMGVADLQARLKTTLGEAQIPDGFCVLSSRALGRSLQLEKPEEQAFVCQQAKQTEVVVFDNLHALFPSSLQAGPESCEKLNGLVDALHLSGKTVILIHHSSRGGASFGSSVKELGLELQLKVTRKGSEVTITPEAARGLSPEQMVPRHFVIPTSCLCLDEGPSVKALPAALVEEDEDELDQAIRRELDADPAASCRTIAEKVGVSKSTVSERLKKIKAAN